jgi:hypothetical protein
MQHKLTRSFFIAIIALVLLLTISFDSIFLDKYDDEYNEYNGEEATEIPEMQRIKIKNLLDDEEKLKMSWKHQIFFIESHMEQLRNLTNPRQACSVESAG